MTLNRLFPATLAPIALLGLTMPAMAEVVVRQQTVRPSPRRARCRADGERQQSRADCERWNPAVHLPRRAATRPYPSR
jgi:hypothetical protein